MKVVRWAVRALVRAPLRAGLLVGVLGVSVGLALIMITVNGAFAERIDEIRSEVGTTITVRPAGSFGGGGFFISRPIDGGPETGSVEVAPDDSTDTQPTLSDDNVNAIAALEHVESYSRRITGQYSGDGLESTTIEPPAGITAPDGSTPQPFQVPIIVTGTDDPSSLASLGVENAEIVEGRTFNSDEVEADVAVIGQTIAETNELSPGDTFDFDGTTIEVVGIFTTGTQFGDNAIFLPLESARKVLDRAGEVDEIAVQADTAGNVSAVAEAIRTALTEDVADVTTQEAQFDAISAPLTDAQDSSQIAMWAALIASAAVILFSIGIVARQRIREIGILKAVGASNWHVVSQMTVETAFLSVTAAVLGALATFPLAQKVADGLVSEPAAATGPRFITDGGPRAGGFAAPGADAVVGGNAAGGVLGGVDVAVSPEIFGYALAIAIGLAVIATIIPAWYVGRVRPAEVLRYE